MLFYANENKKQGGLAILMYGKKVQPKLDHRKEGYFMFIKEKFTNKTLQFLIYAQIYLQPIP